MASRRTSREVSEMPIGRYTRLDEIGRGSFATVYQGVHTRTRTYVAIKSVNLSRLNKKLKENLYSEIRILKGLYHPHIVALIDCHETTSHIHLVMEYCALGDLSMFIKRRESLGSHRYTRDMMAKYPNPRKGALNEVIVRHFLKQLSSALKFLRASNLIHRDIKPQNLLLCPAPSSYRSGVAQVIPFKGSEDSFNPTTGLESLPMLKIADFGFARSLPATSLAETLCGSPLYMAPEILRYEKYDAKADLWSVGTVLYEMIVGKPPFRASNHVELLRKIERGEDRIKFPEDNPASEDLKKLIRLLLKRNPVERMTFSDFFENTVITDEIPGLIREDQPAPPSSSSQLDSRSGSATPTETRQPMRQEEPPTQPPQSPATEKATAVRRPSMTTRQKSGTTPPPDGMPMRRVGSADRPPSSAAALARESPRPASPPIRYPAKTNFTPASPTAPNPDRQRERIAERPEPRNRPYTDDSSTREARERAAQEVAFERDYVVVEKRAVEVNAFADEMAHSPRIHGGYPRPGQGGTIARRTTIANVPNVNAPNTTPSQAQAQPDKAMQIVTGRQRADSSHSRQNSYERRYGQSPTSATSAISKALNMASGRLFGMGFSPPMPVAKGGRSPPLAYNPFPAYPTSYPGGPQSGGTAGGGGLIAGDGSRTNMALDEDSKTVQIIEECATRSDVVYGFAEVKYKQLIPLAPSAQPYQQMMKPTTSSDDQQQQDADDGDTGLTVDAIVTLSEEALVLYVKALSLLAKTMDIAGAWWTRKNRGEPFEPSVVRGEPPNALVGTRVNNVVQWVRGRFNEVLEKAEFVRLKLLEGQKRLGHPGNNTISSSTGSVDVVVSSGVTAEKLMYDRALEMSRTAAINELTSEDLQGCEIAYVTAIRMLEAVLEDDELSRPDGKDDKIMLDDRHVEDRQIVLKLVAGIRGRLAALRKKLSLLTKRVSTPPAGKVAMASPAIGATPPK